MAVRNDLSADSDVLEAAPNSVTASWLMRPSIALFLFVCLGWASFAYAGFSVGERVTVQTPSGRLSAIVIAVRQKGRLVVQYEVDSRQETVLTGKVAAALTNPEEMRAFESDLKGLGDECRDRQNRLERQKAELAKCEALTRIPRTLVGFCQMDCPQNLAETTIYLCEFTKSLGAIHLNQGNMSARSSSSGNDQQEATCKICMDDIDPDCQNSARLECGHAFHVGCLQETLKSYLEQEKSQELTVCPDPSCHCKISPAQLALITRDSDQALAIQRTLVRSVDCLKFCPSCGEGIARFNDHLSFAYNCPNCHKDLCFSCGKPPHHDISCEELATNEGVQRAFIQNISNEGRSELFGFCPHCRILIERKDGCSSMTCGQNAGDKNQIAFVGRTTGQAGILAESKGCGKKFDWNSRILLTAPAGSQGAGGPSAAAELARAPAVQAQNFDALIVPPGDPNFVQGFAVLGPQYRIADPTGAVAAFTLSSRAAKIMTQREAAGWEGAGFFRSSVHYPGFCEQHDGNAPTREQFEALGRALRVTGEYTPLPGMTDRWFWSSSLYGDRHAYSFGGSVGGVYTLIGYNNGNVVCVR